MTNPFMVTSNECYGMSLPEAAKRASYVCPIDVEKPPLPKNFNDKELGLNKTVLPSHDLSFLYSRESDCVGKGSPYSDSALSRVFREKESDSMNKRRKNSIFVTPFCNDNNTQSSRKTISKEEVAETIANYTHNPKAQNPLYGTTANEFGLRKPTEATQTTARYGLSQKFSQSFNRTMFSDEGLNASMTKSKIHDHLTTQFI